MTLGNFCCSLLDLFLSTFWFVYSVVTWPLRKLKASLISVIDYLFDKTISTFRKLLILWSIFVLLVVLSLMLYAAFYSAYVPTSEISRLVHLVFSVCSTGVGICSFPSGNVTFYNEDGTVQEFLGPGQAYSVELVLVAPDSQANLDLGMFMVAVRMFDKEGQVSATSQRSTMFRYRSVYIRALEMVILSPLYLLGFIEQKKTLIIEIFSHFVDDYYHPSVGASVEIHSHKIEVYSVTIRLIAKFTGLKYFLHNWPILSAFCAFWFNLSILTLGVALVLFQRESQRKTFDRQGEVRVPDEDPLDPQETSKMVALDYKDTHEYGTQTQPSGPDGLDLPLIQEPADFPVPAESEELFVELRQRRVN